MGFYRKRLIFTFGLIWTDGGGNLKQKVLILCFYWLYLGLYFFFLGQSSDFICFDFGLLSWYCCFCRPYLDSWAKLAMNRSWLTNLKLNVTSSFKSYTLLQRQLRCFYIFTPCIFFNWFRKLFFFYMFLTVVFSQHFQRHIVRAIEGFISVSSKQMEIGNFCFWPFAPLLLWFMPQLIFCSL